MSSVCIICRELELGIRKNLNNILLKMKFKTYKMKIISKNMNHKRIIHLLVLENICIKVNKLIEKLIKI
jgi:hypothetical protein